MKRLIKQSFAILILLTIAIAVALILADHLLYADRSFDAKEWQDANQRIRGQMLKNLIDSGVLIGKSRSEVRALLGRADFGWEDALEYEFEYAHGGLVEKLTSREKRGALLIHFNPATERVESAKIRT